MRFGEQRPPRDLVTLALLLLGFSLLALAVFVLHETLFGLLLPLTFIAGAIAGLRGEVRELELAADRLIIRTFFRAYRIPKAHIRRAVIGEHGVEIDVLNGTRYAITPPDVDPAELHRTLTEWLTPSG